MSRGIFSGSTLSLIASQVSEELCWQVVQRESEPRRAVFVVHDCGFSSSEHEHDVRKAIERNVAQEAS